MLRQSQSNISNDRQREKFLAQFGSSKIGITSRDGSLTCLNSHLAKIPSWRSSKDLKLPEITRKLKPELLQQSLVATRIPRLSTRKSDNIACIDTILKNMQILNLVDDRERDLSQESIFGLERNVLAGSEVALDAYKSFNYNQQDDIKTRFMNAIKRSSKWGPGTLLELAKIVEVLLPFDDIPYLREDLDLKYDFNLEKYDFQDNVAEPMPKPISPTSNKLERNFNYKNQGIKITSQNIKNPDIKPTPQTFTESSSKPLPLTTTKPHSANTKPPLPKRKILSYSEMLKIPNPSLHSRLTSTSSKYTNTPPLDDLTDDINSINDLAPESSRRSSSIKQDRPYSSSKPYLPPITKLGGLGPSMDSEMYLKGVSLL
jgi:hypothetical protein